MNYRARQFDLHSIDKLFYEIEVLLSADTFVAPTEVLRILQALLVVGADIKDDR